MDNQRTEVRPSQLLRAAIPKELSVWQETHWVPSFSLELCELYLLEERRELSPTGGFACQALSVLSVYLSLCVSRRASLSAPVRAVLCLRVRAPTPAAARFITWHACVSANVDSVTRWASHTFQNKRLPPRITIDPCGALGCIWKERVCNFVSLSLSLSFSQPDLSSEECYVSACLQKKERKKCTG